MASIWEEDSVEPWRVAPGRCVEIHDVLAWDDYLDRSGTMTLLTQTMTRAAEGLPRRRFTIADVEAMVAAGIMEEDERVELIGGELVPMSPKGNRHEMVKTGLLERWYKAARRPTSLLHPKRHFVCPRTRISSRMS